MKIPARSGGAASGPFAGDRGVILCLAHAGLSLIPLEHGTKHPPRGFSLAQHFAMAASLDQVRAWMAAGVAVNIGLCLGSVSRGVIAIDVDGDAGLRWCLERGGLGSGPWFATGKGWQFLVRCDPRLTNVGYLRLHPEVELLMDRHLSVLPPSLHPNGTSYVWGTDPLTLLLLAQNDDGRTQNAVLEVFPGPPAWVCSSIEAVLRDGRG